MEEKEMRKHIKPFLKFSIEILKKDLKTGSLHNFLCNLAYDYTKYNHLDIDIAIYLEKRLWAAIPKDARDKVYPEYTYVWWRDLSNEEGIKKRIGFCKLQLKIVKV